MAPHVFIEPECLKSIDKAAEAFENTDFGVKLGKYHRDARKTFYGWADVWLDPDFVYWNIREDYLPGVRCRVLGIQGYDDEYGSMAQLDEIASRVSGPAEFLRLDYCGHSPFRDQPDKTLARTTKFVQKILR